MADILTNRQAQILSHFKQGKTYQDVASLFGISIETVRKHAYNIYRTLDVSNKIEAINKFFGDN